MVKTLACLGVGHMSSIILQSILDKKLMMPDQLILADKNPEALTPFIRQGAHAAETPAQAATDAQMVLLGVRPAQLPPLLCDIAPVLDGKAVISIAAGVPISAIQALTPGAYVMRVMPNVTIQQGRGATAIAEAPDLPPALFQYVVALFSAAGIVEVLPENLLNAVIPLNGSSPAFFYRFVRVMADFARAQGLDESSALRLAAQTMAGAADVLLQSGRSPEALEREVATPGGTTEAALNAFTKHHLDEAITAGLNACKNRAEELAT